MDAIVGMTSLAAQSMNLDKELGAIAAGLNADLVAIDGDPLQDTRAAARAFRDAKWKGLQAMKKSLLTVIALAALSVIVSAQSITISRAAASLSATQGDRERELPRAGRPHHADGPASIVKRWPAPHMSASPARR
jgi:hypothetical protein